MSSTHIAEGEKESVIDIDRLLRQKLGTNEAGSSWSSNDTNIPKVAQMLREIESNKECYDPLVVSIGPFHHGNERLQLADKYLKYPLALEYVNGVVVPKEFAAAACEAKSYYAEESTKGFDDKTFTTMMLLDGCFVLQFIDCFVNQRSHLKDKMKDHNIAFIQRDLFLLENQLPFHFLELLMSIKYDGNEGLEMLQKFIKLARKNSPPAPSQPSPNSPPAPPLNSPPAAAAAAPPPPAHLLDLMWKQLIDTKEFEGHRSSCGNDWFSYRSAQELKTAGIHFRQGKGHLLTDVSYKSEVYRAVLKLPPMVIDDSTKSLLLNLVAYEMSTNGPQENGVTSYVCFMDSLIDHVEDVKELRKKGILLNFLGSDQEVADLFNQIATHLVPNPWAYHSVKEKIEEHYKNKKKVWFAEWLHTHFSSPWTVLAFIAAIFALFLSSVQTYLAAFPLADDQT